MIHYSKSLDLEVTYFEYQHDRTRSVETIQSQTSNHKHVENIRFLDKPTYDTSFERS